MNFEIKPYVSKKLKCDIPVVSKFYDGINNDNNIFKQNYLKLPYKDYDLNLNFKPILNYRYASKISTIKWNKSYIHLFLVSSLDGTFDVWNLHKLSSVQRFIMKKGIAKAIWSYDNRNVISINYEKRLDIFDIEKGVNKLNYEHDKYLTSLINHPTDSNIIITGSKNEILAWDLRKKLDNPIKYYRFLFGQSLDTIFLPNNEIFINSGDLISQSADEPNLLAWDFKSAAIVSNQIYKEKYSCPKLLTENTGHPAKFYAQTNGNYIAIFSVRPPYKMNKRKRFQGGHTVDGFSVDMDQTPNSKYLISGSSDGKIYIYNSNTTSLFSSLDLNSRDGSWNSKNPDSKAITALSIHPNYSSLVGVGDFGGNLRLITI